MWGTKGAVVRRGNAFYPCRYSNDALFALYAFPNNEESSLNYKIEIMVVACPRERTGH